MVPLRESHILKLPSEILQTIIHLSSLKEEKDEYYEFHGWPYPEHSYVHLKSIALCCRRLYILVAPFLWRDKEFILPREDDEKSENPVVQMATDILSKKALFQQDHYLGDYVRSLCRDLTHGPHYNLTNSKLMAQLVMNLRALRIDFHPKARTEEYGLRYFVEYCPNLSEIYLSNCRDTFDDFLSLHQYKPPITSLTLTDCTIKEVTLQKLSSNSLPLLSKLLLQQVLIEPSIATRSNTHLIDTTHQFIHPFHYQNTNSTAISSNIYQSFVTNHQLTQLALSDSISYTLVQDIVVGSPHLEKLAIVLHDIDPIHVNKSLRAIGKLSNLSILSLAFRKVHPISKESEKIPCHVSARSWNLFATKLPLLRSLYISATRLLFYQNFTSILFNTSPHLSNVIIHNIARVTTSPPPINAPQNDEELLNNYIIDSQNISFGIQDWNMKNHLYTYEQAKEKGFDCFDETDQVCFIKGFL